MQLHERRDDVAAFCLKRKSAWSVYRARRNRKMKARNALPIIVTAVMSAGALISTTVFPETSPRHSQPELFVAEPPRHSAAFLAYHGDRDAMAVHDMTLHAARHFEMSDVQSASFQSWPDWTPDWELRSLEFECHRRIEIVYQATLKRQPEYRYTITGGSAELTPRDWERAE
jgi:hypothetical protein